MDTEVALPGHCLNACTPISEQKASGEHPCDEGQETSCIYPTSMARDGLHMGLTLQQRMTVNPLKFGFVGATDTHNSNSMQTFQPDTMRMHRKHIHCRTVD